MIRWEWHARQGTGMRFAALRHVRCREGLGVPYSTTSAKPDRCVAATYQGAPMAREEYHATVEALCGKCDCGGRLRFGAAPRCRSAARTTCGAIPKAA